MLIVSADGTLTKSETASYDNMYNLLQYLYL